MAERRRAGFQGAPGAFSEDAVVALAPDAEPVPRESFGDVVRAVEAGEDDLGVIPVENTLAGTVVEAYDALYAGAVRAVGEIVLPIRHCLLGSAGVEPDRLREVRSHPVALAQCRSFFAAHPGVRAQPVFDTAGAAREVQDLGDPGVAAIASERAADRYGLAVLARDLQDRNDNQTRFYLVRPRGPGEEDAGGGPRPFKTSLVVELENRAGALHGLLGIFARRDLTLTHITSRPAPTPWTYRFIVELLHDSAEEGAVAVEAAAALATDLRVLGTFVAWRPSRPG